MGRSLIYIGSTVAQSETVSTRWREPHTAPAEITHITVNPNTPLAYITKTTHRPPDVSQPLLLFTSMVTAPTVRPAKAKLVLLPTIVSGN